MNVFMNGVTAGLAFGHIVGGLFGLFGGALAGNLQMAVMGLLCESVGVYVVFQLVYERRFPFHRVKP